jgi:hypothetical protein
MSGDRRVEEPFSLVHAGTVIAVSVREKDVSWMDIPKPCNRIPYDPNVAAGVHERSIMAVLVVYEIRKIRVEPPDRKLYDFHEWFITSPYLFSYAIFVCFVVRNN